VGAREDLERDTLTASRVNWMSGETPPSPIRASARIRYRHKEAPATIAPLPDGRVRVTFDEPQSAITPGQAVVFYDGEVVLGGGWID
jgi:tRNA-specific 2-thiouridylase